jgi:hypothetical protein
MIVNTEETNVNEEWRSCCLKADKNMVKYISQVGILGGLIIFSATMLVSDKDCNSQRNYSSLLMICLGTLIPSPKLER